MSVAILTVIINSEHDTVTARQRARQIARLLGFESQDQTRISTAVSEMARNAFNYAGGGRVEYVLEGKTAPQLFIVKISDSGPGIRDLDTILEGRYTSKTGMGLGIIGARRLMDQFEINSIPGKGTTIWLKKLLPGRASVLKEKDLAALATSLAQERPQDALQELRHQNQELLSSLEENRAKQKELEHLNRELEDTNRGVVALYAELDEKAVHLRRADELKSKFLSNMSHEFRSPLNSILALSGLLLDGSDGDLASEQVQQVGYIKRAAQDLLELVNDLLDLAKVEAGKVEAKPLEFEAEKLFGALRGMLRPLFLNQSVDLVFEDVSQLPTIYSDEGKISQILRNLISNALKFTEKGEVRVSASLSNDDEISFSVSDTGIGIEPENLELIFQDFAQVDNPIQRRVKGTGLGLPLSRKLAALLGGDLRVHSSVGKGSSFTVRLPLHYQEAIGGPEAGPAVWVRDPNSKPVLVVEDSPEMIMMYKGYMRGSGFQVVPAASVREAERILETVRPEAIILDIVLRSETTWPFLAMLKESSSTKDIPVLVSSTLEDQAKAYHLGVDGYLLKPIERTPLIRELMTLTGKRPLSQVLIIDDDERDRYILKQQMKQLSLVISEATGGMAGIRRAAQEKPDLIFLDLNMPDIDGFETLDRLKAVPSLESVPVVIVTSKVVTSEERDRLMTKAVAIMSKESLDKANLLEFLRRTLPLAAVPAAAAVEEE